jgi:putative membrane protein
MKWGMRVKRRRHLWKGLLAGALGGFAGSFAMSQFHDLLQRGDAFSRQRKDDSTVKAATAISQCVFQHELTEQQKKIAAPAVHYAFGTSVGAIYGTLVESRQVMRAGWGLPFGAVVWLGAHAIAVPALGLSEPITESDPGSEAAEFGAHLVYGVTVESVRRLLRR